MFKVHKNVTLPIWFTANVKANRQFDKNGISRVNQLSIDFGSEPNFFIKGSVTPQIKAVQVNLFQKQLFLHQLTHNMTKDCSLFYLPVQYMLCTQIIFLFLLWHSEQFMHNMFSLCSELVVFTELVNQWTIVCHIVG